MHVVCAGCLKKSNKMDMFGVAKQPFRHFVRANCGKCKSYGRMVCSKAAQLKVVAWW